MCWLVLLAVALLVAGCGPFSSDIDDPSDDIAAAVESASASGARFRLADATDFEWDRFYVFAPYFTQEAVDKQLGFHWGDAEDSLYTGTEGGNLLVFVRDGKVVKAFDQDSGHGDFSCVETPHGLSPRDAVLWTQRYTEEDETWDVVRTRGRLGPTCPF
jgi:hypothetical protein